MVQLRLICLLLLSEVLAFRWSVHKRSYHRTGITISDLVHIQQSTYCQRCSSILHATSVNVKGSVGSGTGDDTSDLGTQFEEWAEEEIEEQRREVEDLVRAAEKDGTVDELPGYMLRLLEQFDEDGVDDSVPVVASLLPIIAVIGRPNTGKSTIVNRLTNSYKVMTFPRFTFSPTSNTPSHHLIPSHTISLTYTLSPHLILSSSVLSRMVRLSMTSQVSPVTVPTVPACGTTTTSKWSTPEASFSTTSRTFSPTKSPNKPC